MILTNELKEESNFKSLMELVNRDNMKKPLILIVDDDRKSIQLIANLLTPIGVEISIATSAEKALTILETVTPDLIILDIIMPGTDGFEFFSIIKKKKLCENTPVVFLSGKTDTEDIVRGFQLGAREYISKPIIKEELIARVKSQLLLKSTNDKLLEMVAERTKKLEESYQKVSEYNTALKVLLEKREEDKKDLESSVISNVKTSILPFLEILKKCENDKSQQNLIAVVENNIKMIVTSFSKDVRLEFSGYGLTNREFEILNLIKDGYSSTKIADTLNTSESTISFHRNNIRKKLGIIKKGVSLQRYLNSIEQNKNKCKEVS